MAVIVTIIFLMPILIPCEPIWGSVIDTCPPQAEVDSDKTIQIINGDNNLVIDQNHDELIINNYSDGKKEVIKK